MDYRRWRVVQVIAAVLSVAACGESPSGPQRETPGIAVISGNSAPDTVLAILAQPLVVQVADSAGLVREGLTVRFESVPVRGSKQVGVHLAGPAAQSFTSFVPAVSDARGRAEVRVRYETLAGRHAVALAVPELGYRDTVWFTVAPGAAARVVAAPLDSAMYAVGGYTLRAWVADRFGNARSDAVSYELARGPVSLNGAAVTGITTGRAAIVARAGSFTDTSYVSIVPRGMLAAQAYDPGNGGPVGLAVFQLDGSEYRIIGSGVSNRGAPHGLDWSPDGREVVLTRGSRVQLIAPGGSERTLTAIGEAVGHARYSHDGSSLFLSVSHAQNTASLYRVNVDGSGARAIGAPGLENNPSPSPDGKSVAYVSRRSPCDPETCVRILDVAANRDREFRVRGTRVAWSPNQELLAINSGAEIILVRPDGTGQRVVATGMFNVTWLDWSPDGRWLVVGSLLRPVTLLDTQSGDVLPLGYLASHGEAAWRP